MFNLSVISFSSHFHRSPTQLDFIYKRRGLLQNICKQKTIIKNLNT